jgi:hypothetical protein
MRAAQGLQIVDTRLISDEYIAMSRRIKFARQYTTSCVRHDRHHHRDHPHLSHHEAGRGL